MTIGRYLLAALLLSSAPVAAEEDGPALRAMAFFTVLLSAKGRPDCSGTDDLGDYKGISTNCRLRIADNELVEIDVKEVRGRVVQLGVQGSLIHPESITYVQDAIDAVLFYQRANGDGQEDTDRVNLAAAIDKRRELLEAIEYRPYSESTFAGSDVQASSNKGTIRVTVFRPR